MKEISGRQRQIIAAALELVAEHGAEALTIRNIAGRVGFSDAAVYRHFRSKSQILSTVVDLFADSSQRSLTEIQDCGCSSLEKVRLFFLDRCRVFAADRALATVMFAEGLFQHDPALAARLHEVLGSHRRLLLRTLRAGQLGGTIRRLPPEHLFTMIMGSLRLLVLQWHIGGQAFDLPRSAEKMWHTLETLIARPKEKIIP